MGASNEDDKLTTKVISNNYENLATTSEKVLIETVHFFKMICSVHCFEQ